MSEELSVETIIALANCCDGWSILRPSYLIGLGLPKSTAEQLTRVYKSDYSSFKGTIFVEGKPVDQVEGIYSLSLLAYLAELVGVESTAITAIGRGSQAEQYQREIYYRTKKGIIL